MDLEENIRIAAITAALDELWDVDSYKIGFIAGAKSQAAKDYWYNIFKNGDHIVNGKAPYYPHGIIQSDPLFGATQKDFDNVKPKNIGIIGSVDVAITGTDLIFSIEKIPFEMGGLGQEHYKGVIAIVPDQATMDYAGEITRMIAEDKSIHQVIVVTKETYKES